MSLSDGEKTRVSELVQKLLVDEIHGEFLDLYAAAVSLAEKHPEQVNNELRNALTHLARAAAADSWAEAQKEIASAERHIERAKRDTIKIAVVKLRDLIADACANIKLLKGTVDPAFILRRDEIHRERKAIVKLEAKGGAVINRFADLYLKADKLYDDLVAVLADGGSSRPKWGYRLIAWRRLGGAFLAGLISAVAAKAVYDYVKPHLPSMPAAVSSPSTGSSQDGPARR